VVEARKRPAVEQFPRAWSFLTGHARVLLAVARDPNLRVKEIAEAAGITERYAYRVLSDLQTAGYVHRGRRGRCNHYRLDPDLALGDSVVKAQSTRALLRLTSQTGGDVPGPIGRWKA
jgi:DNA-binding IclR family transcriptional regulator